MDGAEDADKDDIDDKVLSKQGVCMNHQSNMNTRVNLQWRQRVFKDHDSFRYNIKHTNFQKPYKKLYTVSN